MIAVEPVDAELGLVTMVVWTAVGEAAMGLADVPSPSAVLSDVVATEGGAAVSEVPAGLLDKCSLSAVSSDLVAT